MRALARGEAAVGGPKRDARAERRLAMRFACFGMKRIASHCTADGSLPVCYLGAVDRNRTSFMTRSNHPEANDKWTANPIT
jgi:hypothetical protein